MSFWKRKYVNAAAIVAVCLVGIFSDFGADVDFEGRKLQLDQSAAPAKGMSKVSVVQSVFVPTKQLSDFSKLILSPLLHK